MTTATAEQWQAWHTFYVMRRRLDNALDRELQRESAISAAEYETLIALHQAPDHQLRVKDLAIAMSWEKSRVSHQVTRMEKRGFIERTKCATDARGAWVTLTTRGRRTVFTAMRGHNRALERYFFEVLDDRQTSELAEISERMLAALAPACEAEELRENA